MALHGEIKVNHNEVARWEAVRIEPLDTPGAFSYRCHVEYRDNRGYLRKTGPFIVHHHYDDGALMLAAKVIHRGDYLIREYQ